MSYARINIMDVLPIVLFVSAVAATIFMTVCPGLQSRTGIRVPDDWS